MGIGKRFGKIIYAFDQFGNAITEGLFSKYDGEKDETWSSSMGKQLAVEMYKRSGGDPRYPWKYPVGKFSNWLCNQVEKDHSLKSIEWDEGDDIRKDYPGIKEMVDSYLLRGGSKSHRGLIDLCRKEK